MALLTTAEVRALVETDLTDAALTLLIDDADVAITDRYGPHNAVSVTVSGGDRLLHLRRPIDTTQPVVVDETASGVTTILAAADYRVEHGGRTLVRLDTGTNPGTRWGDTVGLAYTPTGVARRKRVLVDLVLLAITYRGLDKQVRAGDSQTSGSVTPDAYQREREKVLTELDDGPVLV